MRRIAILGIAAGVLATSACSASEVDAVANALGVDLTDAQSQTVAVALSQPHDCYGAMERVWPRTLWSWARGIIWRESRNNPRAQNSSSTAAGCFQIVRGTWLANAACAWSSRYDAMCNARTAYNLYRAAGAAPW